MLRLRHIVSVVSWSHWVFRVSQQTPLSVQPDQGWSGLGRCPSCVLLTSLATPSQLEPSRCFLCRLHVVVNGSASSCNAPPPASGTLPSFPLAPSPSCPPRAWLTRARSAVLWPQRPTWCPVSKRMDDMWWNFQLPLQVNYHPISCH